MATNLADFLDRLARDPDLLAAFRADKAGTMTEYGVSAEQQEAILSGDPDRIRAALGDELLDDHGLDVGWFS
jgi:hypothetical protein